MFFFKKLLSRLFRVNSVINQTNDSGTSNSSNNLKQYTDVKEVESLIEKAQKSGKGQNLKMDISLNPDDYDYLAKKYPQYKLYLSLNVELKIEEATTYKVYVQTLQLLREGWNVVDEFEDGALVHKIKTTVNECDYNSRLSQLLKPLSRKIKVVYRREEYSFSEFKNALYKYKEHSIPRLDDYLIQNDTNSRLSENERQEASLTNSRKIIDIQKSNTLDFVAIDFETANNKRSSACSIGLVVVENGSIANRIHHYINPGFVEWGQINIAKHKIKPEMVEDANTFDVLWPKISHLFENTTVIAHNASSFDISVLRSCLEMYDIPSPRFKYGCTMEAAKRNGWEPKLKNLCAIHGISLKHHDALSDAEACAMLAIKLHNENLFHTLNITPFY